MTNCIFSCFSFQVRNCVAHDGKRTPIQLVNELGCIIRPKIMSKFQKIKNFGASATVVSYAYFQAFKFPDSMNVHFQCAGGAFSRSFSQNFGSRESSGSHRRSRLPTLREISPTLQSSHRDLSIEHLSTFPASRILRIYATPSPSVGP